MGQDEPRVRRRKLCYEVFDFETSAEEGKGRPVDLGIRAAAGRIPVHICCPPSCLLTHLWLLGNDVGCQLILEQPMGDTF